MANLNLSQFTEKTFVADADWVFVWDAAGSISKKVSRNSLLNSGTLATSAPVTISQTWNDAAVAFTALKVDATSTNSASGSLLLDLQVGGVTQFSVRKDGRTKVGNVIDVGAAVISWENPYLRTYNLFSCAGIDVSAYGATVLRSDAPNTLALRNGAAAQTFNVYGTYTSITDYKRLSLSCSNTTGNATIGVPFNSVLAVTGGSATATVATVTFAAQAAAFPIGSSVTVAGVTPAGYNATAVVTASTTTSVSYANTVNAAYVSGGTATVSGSANWILQSGGHLLAGADNSYDIGAGGANRPRNVYVGSQLAVGTSASFGGFIFAAKYYWDTTKGLLDAPSDGVFTFSNRAATDFNRLQFGGTSASFPALKRSTTSLQAVLANDSGFTNIQGKLTTDTAYTGTTVVPTGFITLYDSTGTAYKVPCVAA